MFQHWWLGVRHRRQFSSTTRPLHHGGTELRRKKVAGISAIRRRALKNYSQPETYESQTPSPAPPKRYGPLFMAKFSAIFHRLLKNQNRCALPCLISSPGPCLPKATVCRSISRKCL